MYTVYLASSMDIFSVRNVHDTTAPTHLPAIFWDHLAYHKLHSCWGSSISFK